MKTKQTSLMAKCRGQDNVVGTATRYGLEGPVFEFLWEQRFSSLHTLPGTAVVQWLRCCATIRKVAGSIPAGVSGFLFDIKSFQSHYGPGVNPASNINEYREYFLRVKVASA